MDSQRTRKDMKLKWYVFYDIVTESYIITNNSNGVDCVSGPHTFDDAREVAKQLNS